MSERALIVRECQYLRRMAGGPHRSMIKALNYSAALRQAAQRIAKRCRTKLPPSAVADLRILACERSRLARGLIYWAPDDLIGKSIVVQVKKPLT